MPRHDPELMRQLDASGQDDLVDAVVELAYDADAALPTPEDTGHRADALMRRAAAASRRAVPKVHVYGHLGSFAVSARPDVIRALLDAPDVRSVVAAKRPESGFIPPAGKRPATIGDIGRRPRPERPSPARRAKPAPKRRPR